MQNKVIRFILIILFSILVIWPLALLGTCGLIGGVAAIGNGLQSNSFLQGQLAQRIYYFAGGLLLITISCLILWLVNFLSKKVRS
jgi:hypothetical protein